MRTARIPLALVHRALMASLDEIWYASREQQPRHCRAFGALFMARGYYTPTIALSR